MHFTIGTRVYNVRRKWQLKLNGEPLQGLCVQSTRCIWIDAEIPADQLVDVLRHEHTHAWEFETATPFLEEDRANFASTVGDIFDREFSDQGGADALEQIPVEGLRPEGGLYGQPRTSFTITDRVACGHCMAEVMVGSIHMGEPTLGDAGYFVVERGFQCPVCDSVQVWTERSTPSGTPMGEYQATRILTGAEAAEWLKLHQDLRCPYNAN